MPYKIVYCLPSLFSYGGMEKVLTIKANYFAEKFNYDITIILTDGKGSTPAFPLSPKVKVINLDINYHNIWHYKFLTKVIAYHYKQVLYKKRLTKALMSIKPDITISMLRREINFLASIPDGSIKVGELHFNKHNYRDFNSGGKKSGIVGFLASVWMKQLIKNLRKIKKFVVLSYEDKQNWVRDLDNVVVIYNPLDNYPKIQSDCSSKKVIAAGRYVDQKGFDMLIEAWNLIRHKHPEWTLSIYGAGDKTYYQGIIDKLQLQKFIFLYDAVTDLNSEFLKASIFAFPSRFEGFGMTITEAMSCGLPTVAFSCPCGPKDIITNNVNGILVEPEDIAAFAEKLGFLMENEEVRKKLGKNAYTRSKDFDIEIIASQWHQFFTELIQNN